MDKNIPSKQIRSNNKLPWFNKKIKRMLKKKQSLYNQAKRTTKWSNYRFFQKEWRKQIRKDEWNYINNAITEGMKNNNSKPFWKYVKSRKQDNIIVVPLKEKGKLGVSHSKEKAQILIKQFSSVFTRGSVGNLPEIHINLKSTIPSIKIKTEGVEKLLRNINPSKASGPDNIPNRTLKQCAKQLAPSLAIIFQSSIDTGQKTVQMRIYPASKKKEINTRQKTTEPSRSHQ
jgi:hypothetical protein